MRSALRAAALIALFAAPAAAWWFGPKYKSFWRDRRIEVDGDPVEWPIERWGDSDDLNFCFSNDDENLFVMLQPKTRSAKAQLAGSYGQDLTLWVDPSAGMKGRFGINLTAPQKTGDGRFARVVTPVGPEAAKAEAMDLRLGEMDTRGAVEARIPLELLGKPAPEVITVGLEASKPLKTPAPLRVVRREDDSAAAGGKGGLQTKSNDAPEPERFSRVRIWVRVTLAREKRR